MVEGKVTALNPDDFVTPQKPGRRIRATRRLSTYQTQNPVENYIRNNDRCYNIPNSKTEQYKHSFFPKTIIEWNHLDGTIVKETSLNSFKAALAKAGSQQ